MDFYPYPTGIPLSELSFLSPLLRGTLPTDKPKAIHAAWVVIGYGAGRFVPDQPAALVTMDRNWVCDQIDGVFSKTEPQSAIALPWQLIVPMVIQLLQSWLSQQV